MPHYATKTLQLCTADEMIKITLITKEDLKTTSVVYLTHFYLVSTLSVINFSGKFKVSS